VSKPAQNGKPIDPELCHKPGQRKCTHPKPQRNFPYGTGLTGAQVNQVLHAPNRVAQLKRLISLAFKKYTATGKTGINLKTDTNTSQLTAIRCACQSFSLAQGRNPQPAEPSPGSTMLVS
jgi:hypothetical protein